MPKIRLPLITKLLNAVHRRKVHWAYRVVEAEQQREPMPEGSETAEGRTRELRIEEPK